MSSYWSTKKKIVYALSYFNNQNLDLPEFSTATLLSLHVIALATRQHVFYIFRSSSSSTSEMWDLQAWNFSPSLGHIFKIELCWSVKQQMMILSTDCSKIFNSKNEAFPGNAGLCIAFKHQISLATVLTANFGYNQFKSCLRSVPIFQLPARCHLKWQCCSIGIWADALYLDRLSI